MAKMRRPLREGSASTPRYRTQVWAAEQADPRAAYEAAQRPGIGAGLNALFAGVQKAGKNLQRRQDEENKDWLDIEQQRMGAEVLEGNVAAADAFADHRDPARYHADLMSAATGPLDIRLADESVRGLARDTLLHTKKLMDASLDPQVAARVGQVLLEELADDSKKVLSEITQLGRTDFSAAQFAAVIAPHSARVAAAIGYLEKQPTLSSNPYIKQVNGALIDSVEGWVRAGSSNLRGLVSAINATADEGELRNLLLSSGFDLETVGAAITGANNALAQILNTKDNPLMLALDDIRNLIAEVGGESYKTALATGTGEGKDSPQTALQLNAIDVGPWIEAAQAFAQLLEKNQTVQSWFTEGQRKDLAQDLERLPAAALRMGEIRQALLDTLNGQLDTKDAKKVGQLQDFLMQAAVGDLNMSRALTSDFDKWMSRRDTELKQSGGRYIQDVQLDDKTTVRVLSIGGRKKAGEDYGDRLLWLQKHTPDGIPFMLADHIEEQILAASDDDAEMYRWLAVIKKLARDPAKDTRALPEKSDTGKVRVLNSIGTLKSENIWSDSEIGKKIKRYIYIMNKGNLWDENSPDIWKSWRTEDPDRLFDG